MRIKKWSTRKVEISGKLGAILMPKPMPAVTDACIRQSVADIGWGDKGA